MASVTRSLILAVFLAAVIQSQAPSQPATNTSPAGNTSPGGNTSPATTTPGADPASATFSTEQGLLLVAVKPDKVADYEAVIVALQDALRAIEG